MLASPALATPFVHYGVYAGCYDAVIATLALARCAIVWLLVAYAMLPLIDFIIHDARFAAAAAPLLLRAFATLFLFFCAYAAACYAACLR